MTPAKKLDGEGAEDAGDRVRLGAGGKSAKMQRYHRLYERSESKGIKIS